MEAQALLLMSLVVGAFAYFTPAFIAYVRGSANRVSVMVVNVFLGWTFVGWVVALAMATSGAGQRGEYHRQRTAYLDAQRQQAWHLERGRQWEAWQAWQAQQAQPAALGLRLPPPPY